MAQFIFKTNQSELTTYDGPSGTRYTIHRIYPFVVNLAQDIEFFKSARNSKRFEEVGVLKSIIGTKPARDVDSLLRDKLNSINLSDEIKDKIVSIYHSEENITKVLEREWDLDNDIKHLTGDLRKLFLKDRLSEEENKRVNSKKTKKEVTKK